MGRGLWVCFGYSWGLWAVGDSRSSDGYSVLCIDFHESQGFLGSLCANEGCFVFNVKNVFTASGKEGFLMWEQVEFSEKISLENASFRKHDSIPSLPCCLQNPLEAHKSMKQAECLIAQRRFLSTS